MLAAQVPGRAHGLRFVVEPHGIKRRYKLTVVRIVERHNDNHEVGPGHGFEALLQVSDKFAKKKACAPTIVPTDLHQMSPCHPRLDLPFSGPHLTGLARRAADASVACAWPQRRAPSRPHAPLLPIAKSWCTSGFIAFSVGHGGERYAREGLLNDAEYRVFNPAAPSRRPEATNKLLFNQEYRAEPVSKRIDKRMYWSAGFGGTFEDIGLFNEHSVIQKDDLPIVGDKLCVYQWSCRPP